MLKVRGKKCLANFIIVVCEMGKHLTFQEGRFWQKPRIVAVSKRGKKEKGRVMIWPLGVELQLS